jgi:rhodanese-related sulfurtransferase
MGKNATRTIVTLMLTFFLISIGSISEAMKYGEVDAKATKDMMEKENALVVFPLSPIEFDDLHIKGSVNIPMDLLAEELPKDKSRKMIFYCLGVKCVASWRAAEKAVSLGYKNVHAFREGLPGWTAAGYPTVSIEKLPDVKIKKSRPLSSPVNQITIWLFFLMSISLTMQRSFISIPRNVFIFRWMSCL